MFFAIAYRFDNRFVLSMALSTLAAWFGVKITHFVGRDVSSYRVYAIAYSLVVGGAGVAIQSIGIKKHFLGTYLNFAANVLFVAVLSGVFGQDNLAAWTLLLLVACGVSLAYGISVREFVYVAYAAVYGYIGASSLLLRNFPGFTASLLYFVVSGIAMITCLTIVARRFGKEA